MAASFVPQQICVSPSMLPKQRNITFPNTAFFFTEGNTRLPNPAEVREAAGGKAQIGRPDPVAFHSIRLLVKYGSAVTIAEGQCLWAIRRFLPTVPAAEVYGWCQDDGETFIYMQLIPGVSLEKAWPQLDIDDRYEICTQLHWIVENLRQLRQEPGNQFIGNISGQALQDILFEGSQKPGPFPNPKSFNDWFSNLLNRQRDNSELPHPWRRGLLDNVPVVFTHADLHRSNIMVNMDGEGGLKVVGIVDWHQSGWYPAFWEFFKTRNTCRKDEKWEIDFIPEFLQSYRGFVSFEYFRLARGR